MNIQNIIRHSVYYIIITFLSILSLVLIRIFEYTLINYYEIQEISSKILFEGSINLDVYFGIAFSSFLLIPCVLLAQKFSKWSLSIYKIIWVIILIITSCLTHFFISSEYLLTNVIFEFSIEEIEHIISIEGGSKNSLIWCIYLIIPLAIFFLFKIKIKDKYSKWTRYSVLSLYFILLLVIIKNHKHYYKSSVKFDSQYDFYIANNKITHFLLSIKKSSENEDALNSKDLMVGIKDFQLENSQSTYESLEYPLLKSNNYQNVLGNYFKKSNTPPNIVIIVAESLGSSIAGLHKTSEHLLPYIDTLAMEGLYWENFLSNCCRTYGVLPNVLGSLTSGTLERGFVNYNGDEKLGKRYPSHNSLIKELKKNNYFTSFFYGGWGEFDSYSYFLKDQGIDLFTDQSQFDSTKYLAPWKRKPTGFYWGYDDKALFRQWFDYTKKHKLNQPYLSIYMTLNMHEPYNIATSKYYENQFIKKRLKSLKLKSDYFTKKDNYTLGSLFYFEDALRSFINDYKKRSDYDNTIFIIFGDHYSLVSFLNSPLGIYHVPMVVYSPLLKKRDVFKGVSTHLDITPSLLALLKGNFGLKVSEQNHWLGSGLDTSKVFRCNTIAPFNLYSVDFPKFLFHDYFLTQDGVYKVSKDLKATIVRDPKIIKKVNQFANRFKLIDKYVCEKDKIWKDR